MYNPGNPSSLLAESGTVSKSSTTARSNLMELSNRTQKDTAVVPKSPSSSEAVVDVKPTTAPIVKTQPIEVHHFLTINIKNCFPLHFDRLCIRSEGARHSMVRLVRLGPT